MDPLSGNIDTPAPASRDFSEPAADRDGSPTAGRFTPTVEDVVANCRGAVSERLTRSGYPNARIVSINRDASDRANPIAGFAVAGKNSFAFSCGFDPSTHAVRSVKLKRQKGA